MRTSLKRKLLFQLPEIMNGPPGNSDGFESQNSVDKNNQRFLFFETWCLRHIITISF